MGDGASVSTSAGASKRANGSLDDILFPFAEIQTVRNSHRYILQLSR